MTLPSPRTLHDGLLVRQQEGCRIRRTIVMGRHLQLELVQSLHPPQDGGEGPEPPTLQRVPVDPVGEEASAAASDGERQGGPPPGAVRATWVARAARRSARARHASAMDLAEW